MDHPRDTPLVSQEEALAPHGITVGKGDSQLDKDSKSFESVEREFEQVLNELEGKPALDKFRTEYEKLYRCLSKSHDNEKRLIKKCRELNSEIVSNAAKVQSALRMGEEDKSTISTLKGEIEKAWRIVDESQLREKKSKETIVRLREEMTDLSRIVEEGGGNLTSSQQNTMNELLKQKEEVTKERDDMVSTIAQLRNDALEMQERQRVIESNNAELESEVQQLRDNILAKKQEADREQRRKERLEREIADVKQNLEARQQDIKQKQGLITQSQEQVSKLEYTIRDQKMSNDRLQKDLEGVNLKVTKLQQDLEEQIHVNTQQLAENSQKQVELKLKEDEITHLRAERVKVEKIKETTLQKLKQVEVQKAEVENTRDSLKLEILNLERKIESERKVLESERKRGEELIRERDLFNKMKSNAEASTTKQIDMMKISENTKKNLEHEIQGYKTEAQKQMKMIYQLEKEREKYATEASEATSKYAQALGIVKVKELEKMELQKKIQEGEAKLKQQQSLYEAVRSDRNLYSKNLIEAKDEILEIKRKFKIMNHQIEQLKEEIKSKEAQIVKERFDHAKIDKEKESIQFELTKALKQISEAEAAITSQKAEIEKLNHIINEADSERVRQKQEYEIVVNERDILGTQLIRRNDELSLLYEKIKIQQSILNKGQVQYRERLNEIRILKIKLTEYRRDLSILKTTVASVDGLKKEAHQLGKELLQERTKVKALSEELENPLNVHRWRKLEGSDPGVYEMIQKIHSLQRRLISKTEEVVEKDLLIRDKEALYIELKNILARQPGPEVAEQLSLYQAQLREKKKQMKAMAAELNACQAQVAQYQAEIDALGKELNDLKTKYFNRKRREYIANTTGAATATARAAKGKENKGNGGGDHQLKESTEALNTITGEMCVK